MDAFNLLQALLTFLAAVYLLLSKPRLDVTLRKLKGSAALAMLVYFLFACASALWSTKPLYSFYMGAETAVLLMLTLVLFSHCKDYSQAENLAIGLTVLSIGLDMGTVIYRCGLSLPALHTNTYSSSAAMLLVYGIGEALAAGHGLRAIVKLAILVGGICLLAGTSAGSNVACFLALCLIIIWARRFGMKQLMLLCGVSLLVFGVFLMQESEWVHQLLGGKTLAAVTSAEHRRDLWRSGLDLSLESIALGYGFCVGSKEHLQLTNAHNSFLELLLNTGLVGVSLFSFALVKLALELRTARRLQLPGAQGLAAAFTAVTVNSLSVSILAFSWSPPALSFYAFLALFSLYGRSRRLASPWLHAAAAPSFPKLGPWGVSSQPRPRWQAGRSPFRHFRLAASKPGNTGE